MKLDRSSKQLAGYMWKPVDATTTYGNQVEDARHDDQLQLLGSPSRQDPWAPLLCLFSRALSSSLSCAGFWPLDLHTTWFFRCLAGYGFGDLSQEKQSKTKQNKLPCFIDR
jgi:hypothetical protein